MLPPATANMDIENLLVAGQEISSEDIFPSAENEDQQDEDVRATKFRKSTSSFNLANVLLGKNRTTRKAWLEKGFLSNCLTFSFLLLGMFIRYLSPASSTGDYILGFGLFGFSGGITNWLAVKMLFDKVGLSGYYLYGSGVIPGRFIEIREAIKTMIMKMFFDKEFLEHYLNNRLASFVSEMELGEQLKKAMAEPGFDDILVAKLQEISATPEGAIITTMAPLFGGVEAMVPALKPFLSAFGAELITTIVSKFETKEMISIDSVINEVDNLLKEKLRMITPSMVKELMEEVIREHLGWLVVWGNVFGGGIGLMSVASGYGD